MASASVSAGTSPLSGFEFDFPQHPDSNGDQDEAFWTAISNPGSGSLGPFLSSPSHSLGSSWAVLGNGQLIEVPSPAALPSPLNGNFDHQSPYSATSFPEQAVSSGAYGGGSTLVDADFLSQGVTQDGLEFLASGGFVFDGQFGGEGMRLPLTMFESSLLTVA